METTNIQINRTEEAQGNAEGPVHSRVRREWTKEVNKLLTECYLRSEPKKRRFRKRILAVWNERGLFSATKQQLAGQVKCIKNREWLSIVEIEKIQRPIDNGGEKGVQSTEAEEFNGNVQYQETETRQEKFTEPTK